MTQNPSDEAWAEWQNDKNEGGRSDSGKDGTHSTDYDENLAKIDRTRVHPSKRVVFDEIRL